MTSYLSGTWNSLFAKKEEPTALNQTKQAISKATKQLTETKLVAKTSQGLSKAYEYCPPVRQYAATALVKAKEYKMTSTLAATAVAVMGFWQSYVYMTAEEEPSFACKYIDMFNIYC